MTMYDVEIYMKEYRKNHTEARSAKELQRLTDFVKNYEKESRERFLKYQTDCIEKAKKELEKAAFNQPPLYSLAHYMNRR